MYDSHPMPSQQTIMDDLSPLQRHQRFENSTGAAVTRAVLSQSADRGGGSIRIRLLHHHGLRHQWGKSGLADRTTLKCENCGYQHLDVHRTGTALITYCQQCGEDTESKRDDICERWTAEQKLTRQPDLSVVQGGKKKKKRRQGNG